MLELIDVTKQYPGQPVPALESIRLKVKPGEFVALLGPSGAGKSTFIRCINGLVAPTAGQVIWNGHDVTAAGKETIGRIRREMGMIFQHFHLIGRLDGLTNVIIGCFHSLSLWRAVTGWFPKEVRQEAVQALKRVGLLEVMHRRADGLSGGQQQRVAIARVLMQKPRLLLGDEPVASLDPVASREIMDLLREIHEQEQMTTILNLHDVETAKTYATRIIGIRQGRIVFDGLPQELGSKEVERIYKQPL
ncbi:phosphonates import ATP-binding protein PhnC [Marinithermofilum abyssi]|uniref:Phosphonates import ATP-binding protein PhnC n=1 Tax=Marinithermofilum abyssi TaxID=1571185 RepID=A0A8J2VH45_9BACL|nr:phosphonate ABC transporter ATP-binding protein [Marinithermofilum abyssi]GGE20117.1 phosphonates import ATP-binding protein PhnC [Marinithermofilum abyssi]